NEYWVMEPGFLDGANMIDKQQRGPEDSIEEELNKEALLHAEIATPRIGEVYQKNDTNPVFQAMVVAVHGRTIHLGGNITVPVEEITDTDRWSFVLNPKEQ